MKAKYLRVSDALVVEEKNQLIIRDLWAREVMTRIREYSKYFDIRILAPKVEKLEGGIANPYYIEDEFKSNFVLLPNFTISKKITGGEFQSAIITTILGFIVKIPALILAMLIVVREIKSSDVVHSNASPHPFGIFANILAKKIFNKRVILTIDADYLEDLEFHKKYANSKMKRALLSILSKYYTILFTMAVLNADLVFVIGKSLYNKFQRYNSNKVYLIPSAWYYDSEIDSSYRETIRKKSKRIMSEKPLKVVFASKLITKKGCPELIEIINSLDPDTVTFYIYGNGPFKKQLVKLSEERHDVFYMGTVPYGAPFLNEISGYDIMLVLTNGTEEPRIVYDSWLAGVCLLLPKNETTALRIDDNKTGVFHDNTSSDVVKKLAMLSRSRKHVIEIIRNSNKKALEFSIEKTIRKQLKITLNLFYHYATKQGGGERHEPNVQRDP